MYTKLDFSAKLFNDLSITGILGLSNNESEILNYGLSLGFKNIGVSFERGKINGSFVPDKFNDLVYTDDELDFSSEFKEYSIFKLLLSGAVKVGIQYIEFETPIDVVVNYEYTLGGFNTDGTVNYIDPNGSFKLYGAFFSADMLANAIDMGVFLLGGKKHGFILKTSTTLGVAQISESGFGKDRVIQLIESKVGQPVSLTSEKRTMFGFKTNTGVGYGYVNNNKRLNVALAVGYEYNIIGGLSFDLEDPDFNAIHPETTDFDYQGPYARVLLAW